MSICQEPNGSPTSTVTRELYDFGHREGTTKRFYIKDHLGSVRGMVDESGAVTSAFDYDPYGRMTTLSGTETPSYGFAQLWLHGQTGLNLAVWRAYDPEIGRWISRELFGFGRGMAGGINVYEYVGGQPFLHSDPSGLIAPLAVAAGAYAVFEAASTAYDAYGVYDAFSNPCSSGTDKALAMGGFVAGLELPGPGAGYKVLGSAAVVFGKRFSPAKEALVDMAKADKKTGITSGDMEAYIDLNKELPDPFPSGQVRGPEIHPNRPHGQFPHGHVGPVNHIPIK